MATEHWIEGELYVGPRPVYCNMFWSFVSRICGHGVHVHPVSRGREIWSGSEEHVFRFCVNWVVGLITNDWIIVWVGGFGTLQFHNERNYVFGASLKSPKHRATSHWFTSSPGPKVNKTTLMYWFLLPPLLQHISKRDDSNLLFTLL